MVHGTCSIVAQALSALGPPVDMGWHACAANFCTPLGEIDAITKNQSWSRVAIVMDDVCALVDLSVLEDVVEKAGILHRHEGKVRAVGPFRPAPRPSALLCMRRCAMVFTTLRVSDSATITQVTRLQQRLAASVRHSASKTGANLTPAVPCDRGH